MGGVLSNFLCPLSPYESRMGPAVRRLGPTRQRSRVGGTPHAARSEHDAVTAMAPIAPLSRGSFRGCFRRRPEIAACRVRPHWGHFGHRPEYFGSVACGSGRPVEQMAPVMRMWNVHHRFEGPAARCLLEAGSRVDKVDF